MMNYDLLNSIAIPAQAARDYCIMGTQFLEPERQKYYALAIKALKDAVENAGYEMVKK